MKIIIPENIGQVYKANPLLKKVEAFYKLKNYRQMAFVALVADCQSPMRQFMFDEFGTFIPDWEMIARHQSAVAAGYYVKNRRYVSKVGLRLVNKEDLLVERAIMAYKGWQGTEQFDVLVMSQQAGLNKLRNPEEKITPNSLVKLSKEVQAWTLQIKTHINNIPSLEEFLGERNIPHVNTLPPFNPNISINNYDESLYREQSEESSQGERDDLSD